MSYDSPTISPEMKARLDNLKETMFSGKPSLANGYPVDVVEVIDVVCELWNTKPPQRKKQKAYWIDAARDLLDACGEFGVECIRAYRKDYVALMLANNGLGPYTVEGPGSLVKSVRAKAATMRQPEMLSAEAQKEIRLRERREREMQDGGLD